MLKQPKNFPVYVASYLDSNKELNSTSMISKITLDKPNNNLVDWGWGEVKVNIITLDYTDINHNDEKGYLKSSTHNCPANVYEDNRAKLVPKDEWIKIVDKFNKLIDERNRQKGENNKRISY